MVALTIRNIPDHVIERLRDAAGKERRSVNQQAIYWLGRAAGLAVDRERVRGLLDEIEANREEMAAAGGGGSDSTELIRKMRAERTQRLLNDCGPSRR